MISFLSLKFHHFPSQIRKNRHGCFQLWLFGCWHCGHQYLATHTLSICTWQYLQRNLHTEIHTNICCSLSWSSVCWHDFLISFVQMQNWITCDRWPQRYFHFSHHLGFCGHFIFTVQKHQRGALSSNWHFDCYSASPHAANNNTSIVSHNSIAIPIHFATTKCTILHVLNRLIWMSSIVLGHSRRYKVGFISSNCGNLGRFHRFLIIKYNWQTDSSNKYANTIARIP